MQVFKKSLFQAGISLIELMVGLGILGGLGIGILSLTGNLQRSQVRMSQDLEAADLVRAIRRELRDSQTCDTSLGGLDPTASSFELADPGGVISFIGDGVDNLVVEGQEFAMGQTHSGAFEIVSMRIWGASTPLDINTPVPARITLLYQRLGRSEDTVGQMQREVAFPIEVILWHTGDPSFDPDVHQENTVRSCFRGEEDYLEAICSSIGGQLDVDDDLCKNIILGNRYYELSDPSPADPIDYEDQLDVESEDFEVLVDGHQRVHHNLEVGYSGVDNLFADNFSADIKDEGSFFIRSLLYVGFDEVTPLLPPILPDNSLASRQRILIGYDDDIPDINLVGSFASRRSLLVGFEDGDSFISGLDLDERKVFVNRGVSTRGGIRFLNSPEIEGEEFIRFADRAFLTTRDIDSRQYIRLSSVSDPEIGILELGSGQDQSISGGGGGIGINIAPADVPNISEQFQVNGNMRVDSDVLIRDGYLYIEELEEEADGLDVSTVPNIGWVVRKIANTFSIDSATRDALVADILNDAFDSPASAQRIIRRAFCERSRLEYPDGNDVSQAPGDYDPVTGTCSFLPFYCNEHGNCENVYSNSHAHIGRDVEHTAEGTGNNIHVNGTTTIRGDARVRGNLTISYRMLVGTGSIIRIQGDLQGESLRAGGRICLGSDDPDDCYSNVESQDCGTGYVIGIFRGRYDCN